MSHAVFISYARQTGRGSAEALHAALGTAESFLDLADIEPGKPFPERLVDALLGSRVVVVFADETYFQRWYCLLELRTALAPFLALAGHAPEEEANTALASIVIARPPEGNAPTELRRLPPLLRHTQWPKADDTLVLARLVRERVQSAAGTLGQRLEAAGGGRAKLRKQLLGEVALPPPMNLAGFKPLYPLEWRPSLREAFKGRANELWRIDFILSTLRGFESAGAALTGALEGGGGFGKTRLALEYLHRFGPRHFPGGLFWVDADVGEDRLEEQFHAILCALRPETPDLLVFRQQKLKVAEALARALDEAAAKKPVLYVVDNVPEAPVGTVPKHLKTWCPALGKVSLLVTSRAKLTLGTEGVHALSVSTLSPDDAVALLTEGLDGAEPSDREWYRIAGWVGYLPLALELLNRALRGGGITREELLAHREAGPVQELDKQMDALRGQVSAGSLRGVTEALAVSYGKLPPLVQQVARLLAWLAPEPIPLALLKALGDKASSAEVRTALTTRHFVSPVRSVKAGDVPFFGTMHRVLADFLRSQSTEPAAEVNFLCWKLMELMEPEVCRDPRHWPLMSACLPHAEKIFGETARHHANPGQAEAENGIKLGLSIRILLTAKGLFHGAREIGAAVLHRATQQLGEAHPMTVGAMLNHAETLFDQGDYRKAQPLQEQALVLSRHTCGQEHVFPLLALRHLSLTLHAQEQYRKARVLQQRLVDAFLRLSGKTHPHTLAVMNDLAATLTQLGDIQAAQALQGQIVDSYRQSQGEEHLSTLTAQLNLAAMHMRLGNHQAAQDIQKQVLESRRRILGEEHPDTLRAMNDLGITLFALKDLQGARECAEWVAEARGRVLGEHHPSTLQAMKNLEHVRAAQERDSGPRKNKTEE